MCTGVEERGEGGRESGALPTGERHNSSKSGVSIISTGNEKVVSSVLVVAGEMDFLFTFEIEEGAAVVVAIEVIRDSRLPRITVVLEPGLAALLEEEGDEEGGSGAVIVSFGEDVGGERC